MEFSSYSKSYENYILRGLGTAYEQQAGEFIELIHVEQGIALSNQSKAALLKRVRTLLSRAFVKLALSYEFRAHKAYLNGWAAEARIASSSFELAGILSRADARLFPHSTDEGQ